VFGSPGANTIITYQHPLAFCTATTKNVYGIPSSHAGTQNTVVWSAAGFDRAAVEGVVDPSSPTSNTFDEVVRPLTGLLDPPPSIPPTRDVRVESSHDPTAEEYYHGYGCDRDRAKIRRRFTARAPEEMAMRVTRARRQSDSAYDTLGWHDQRPQPVARTRKPTILIIQGRSPSTNTARTFS